MKNETITILSFNINDEEIFLDTKNLVEIVVYEEENVIKIQEAKKYIFGVYSNKQNSIPLVDCNNFFNTQKYIKANNKTLIVIIKIENDTIGLLVEKVNGIKKIQKEKIQNNKIESFNLSKYFTNVINIEEKQIKYLNPKEMIQEVKNA